MAKNYNKRNQSIHQRNRWSQIMVVLMAFILGYGSAALYDFSHLSAWLNQQLLMQQSSQPIKKVTTVQQAQLPKPKFEFYTLLTNEHQSTTESAPAQIVSAKPVVTPTPAATAPTELEVIAQRFSNNKIAKTSTDSLLAEASSQLPQLTGTQKLPLHAPLATTAISGSYTVQVASFRNLREAQKMKAALVMKGFDVNIATVTQQHIQWYRIVIGPFASRTQAQQAQLAFARREHIMGMIRKMDV